MVFKRWTAVLFVAVIGLFVFGNAQAQDVGISGQDLETLMDRLEAAEHRIQELEGTAQEAGTEADGQSLKEAAAVAQDSELMKRLESLEDAVVERVKNGHSNSKMSLHGRIHFDHWAFPNIDPGIDAIEDPIHGPQDRLAFRRVRIGVKGDITDNMVYRITIEFANPGSVQYRDVYFGAKGLPFFQQVLVGNQKRPYSLDQLNSSNANVFIERPFIADATQQDTRRLGIQSWNVSEGQAWSWRYGVFNRENTQDDGRYISDHYQAEVAGRLANTLYYDDTDGRRYGHWAIAGSVGWTDEDGDPAANTGRLRARPEARSTNRWLETGAIPGAQNLYLLGVEGALNFGPLLLSGEAMGVRVGRDPGPTTQFWGAYGYVSYFLTGEHIPWDRKSGTLGKMKPNRNAGPGRGAWQVGVRYSYADFNDKDILGGEGKSVAFGLNWWWNPNSRLQFNYIHGRIDNRAISTGLTSGSYDILGTRLMVFF